VNDKIRPIRVTGLSWIVIDILIYLGPEPGGADGKEDQIPWTKIGHPLTARRGDEHDVPNTHVLRRKAADLYAASALEDDVTLGCPDQLMPSRGHPRRDTHPGDRCVRIIRRVRQLDNIALLGSVELRIEIHAFDDFYDLTFPYII
jgi:hypothetical protein